MPSKKTRSAPGPSYWAALVVLSLLGMIVLFDETMILPAIPDFISQFGISYSESSWLLSAYIIAAAVMTPIAGKLSDIYGKKKVLLAVMAVYIVGVVLGRFAADFEPMLAARALQGVGLSMFPIAFGIIREMLPENRLAVGQTVFSAMFPAGAVIGLVGGAAIIQHFGWQATFLAILPFSVALWLAIFKVVKPDESTENPKVPPVDKTIDFKGVFSLAATITLFLSGLTFLESDGGMRLVLGLFLASAASLAVFVFVERRARSPLVDFALMRSRSFLPPTVILLLTFLSMFMVYLTVPVLVRSPVPLGFGGSALDVANVQLPFMAVFLVGTIASGFILNRVRNTRLVLIGSVVSTAGFALLLMSHSAPETVSVGLTVIASGLSLCMTGGFNLILTSVPMRVVGTAMGMAMLLNLVGMSVGPAVAGILQEAHTASVPGFEGAFPTGEAYDLIFALAAVLSACSLGLAVAVNRKNQLPTKKKNI